MQQRAKPPPENTRPIPGEELKNLTITELIQLIYRILQEIEIRSMEQAEEERTIWTS